MTATARRVRRSAMRVVPVFVGIPIGAVGAAFVMGGKVQAVQDRLSTLETQNAQMIQDIRELRAALLTRK